MLKLVARKLLPAGGHGPIWRALSRADQRWKGRHLTRMRRTAWGQKPGARVRFLDYAVRITDGPNFYMQYKDEFIHEIYRFRAIRPDPFIIDGGSNIGLSILYFKRLYPHARILGFEPDPAIFSLLKENISENGLEDVTLINAGLGADSGILNFVSDGSAGGHLGEGTTGIPVRVERLSDYLSEPVDFLKLNIEGEELPVLRQVEASGRLVNIRELVLEYHGRPGMEQRLGPLLDLLDRQGFRYLVHDFDGESCGASKPPFHLAKDTFWVCLVYGRRMDPG